MRIVGLQAAGADWVLYAHLGLARAHRLVPPWWRRRYAVFLHGIEVWGTGLSHDRRAALAGATLRIANSAYTARRIATAHPDVGRIAVCPLALLPDVAGDAAPIQAARILARIGPRSVVIVGRMSAEERYKGHDELIECWPQVLAAVPDAQLVVVGLGNDRDRLMRKAAQVAHGDSVIFPGYVEDATRDALLQRSALFAMPSRGEGFGIVYLQAMRLGIACIGSNEDAAGDVIIDGKTGILVPPSDRQALASAVVSLLQSEHLRRRMGAAGRQRFEQEFTFDRFRDRLGAILADAFALPEAL
jgi:phosphatidylinositol alpha-1,6-mannosyltransferase